MGFLNKLNIFNLEKYPQSLMIVSPTIAVVYDMDINWILANAITSSFLIKPNQSKVNCICNDLCR